MLYEFGPGLALIHWLSVFSAKTMALSEEPFSSLSKKSRGDNTRADHSKGLMAFRTITYKYTKVVALISSKNPKFENFQLIKIEGWFPEMVFLESHFEYFCYYIIDFKIYFEVASCQFAQKNF